MNWETKKLNDVLDYEQPTKYIVETTDYNDSFETPVLTAGKSFLLGYTDEKEDIFVNVPAIIFDDFTTAFHYVDFPFKVKSSAMKILKCDETKDNLKFLYYQMSILKIDTQLHKRYWISRFSNIKFNRPPLKTQQRIAQILDDAAALRDKTAQLLKEYDLLAQSIFLEMFGDPRLNSKGLEIKKLGDLGRWQSGGTPSRKIRDYYEGNIPWLSSGELNQMYISDSKEHITEKALKESSTKLVPKGSLLLGMYDTAALKSTINTRDLACNQAIAFGVLNPRLINIIYAYKIIQIGRNHYRRLQRGARQKNLNLSMVKGIKILYPPIKLQNQFAEKIGLIEQQKKLAKQELQESEYLFNCLLQKAFKGELFS
jgi:type I restriction enzyme S subunit